MVDNSDPDGTIKNLKVWRLTIPARQLNIEKALINIDFVFVE